MVQGWAFEATDETEATDADENEITGRSDGVIRVALDIDDLLTSMEVSALRKQDVLDPVHHAADHFVSITFPYGQTEYTIDYVLVPGCVAFLQFLFGQPGVRLAFFSAGVRMRNELLAARLVDLAIAAGGEASWRARYDVFSREDCFDTEALPLGMRTILDSPYQPPGQYGQLKKDLRVLHYGREVYHELFQQVCEGAGVLLPDAERDRSMLAEVILIEEDPSYLFPGQERNMLLCPTYRHPYPQLVNYQHEDIPSTDDGSFQYTNTLFYAAGVMEHVLAQYAAGGASLPDLLWEAQGGGQEPSEQSHRQRFALSYFASGRTLLRAYFPALNFAVRADCG